MKKRAWLIILAIPAILLLAGCRPKLSTDTFETLDIFTKSRTFVYDRIEKEETTEVVYEITVEGSMVSTSCTIDFDYGRFISESSFNGGTLVPETALKSNSYKLDPEKDWVISAVYGNALEMTAKTDAATETKTLDLPDSYIDNEALLFTVGALSLEEGFEKDINISIIDAGEIVAFRISRIGTEKIDVPYGSIECIKVEIKYQGLVIGMKPRMYIWYTNDENRFPLMYENDGIFLKLKSII
ncbi:MAG: DUF3108 domain-containing protein [Clostridia bacterium]|nr:DUF3108 domain-containing protein [Clostridia bacterium]